MAFDTGSSVTPAAPVTGLLGAPKSSVALPPGYGWITVQAAVIDPFQTAKRRKAYKGARNTLLEMTATRYKMMPCELWGYDLHHRLPISLTPMINGRPIAGYHPNTVQNMDPVSPEEHDYLHDKIIDAQMRGRQPGEVFEIWLPKRLSRPKSMPDKQPGLRQRKAAIGATA